MDMRTKFEFTIDGEIFSVECETWQEALAHFMSSANKAGFTIDAKRETIINEVARSGKITL